jgi:hypothetical protein
MVTSQLHQFVKLIVVVVLSTTVIYGCAQIRKVTYPPEFIYLEQKDITNKMVLMSIYIRQMDQILSRKDSIDSEDQARIVVLLSSINSATDSLGAGSIDTNHLVIDDHIDQFKSKVIAAISAAKANPPNYFAAGQLSGSCVACHQFRKL